MRGPATLSMFAGVVLAASAPAAAQCRLCAHDPSPVTRTIGRPLTIAIETSLDLGRAAHRGSGGSGGSGGSIVLDERSGARYLHGLVDLGGFAIKGVVRLTGDPFRAVRVSVPSSTRLTTPGGGVAQAVDLRTDLAPGATLDGSGSLEFSFGGRLVVDGTATGDFRGRIPITAEYD